MLQACIITGLAPVRAHPVIIFGFRSSVQKNGHPGEGRHEGLVPRNDVLISGFIRFSLAQTLARIFLYFTSAPPPPRNPEGVANVRSDSIIGVTL